MMHRCDWGRICLSELPPWLTDYPELQGLGNSMWRQALHVPFLPRSRRWKSHGNGALSVPGRRTHSHHQRWEVLCEQTLLR